MSGFPDRFDCDITAEDVDLDTEVVYYHGERLTEARAEQIAAEGLRELRRRGVPVGCDCGKEDDEQQER